MQSSRARSLPASDDLQLTFLDEQLLLIRLSNEVALLFRQVKQEWPTFRLDPFGYLQSRLNEFREFSVRWLRSSNWLAAISISLSTIVFMVIAIGLLDARRSRGPSPLSNPDEELLVAITLEPTPLRQGESISAVGGDSNGRVGLRTGKGEGSSPQPKSSRGGGGSGNQNSLPASQGALPQTSEVPAPITPVPKNPVLPVAGVKLDPALWKALPFTQYGDPRSQGQITSQGPGSGGVVGSGYGQGVGEGRGPGFGPGRDGNTGGDSNEQGGRGAGGSSGREDDPTRVFPPADVTQRARLLEKPEPQYTEEARKAQITGTVILRVVFSSAGVVTNIRTIHPLPLGLTERAIAAARQISFIPATRNGHSVSVSMQLEYNFNLY